MKKNIACRSPHGIDTKTHSITKGTANFIAPAMTTTHATHGIETKEKKSVTQQSSEQSVDQQHDVTMAAWISQLPKMAIVAKIQPQNAAAAASAAATAAAATAVIDDADTVMPAFLSVRSGKAYTALVSSDPPALTHEY